MYLTRNFKGSPASCGKGALDSNMKQQENIKLTSTGKYIHNHRIHNTEMVVKQF